MSDIDDKINQLERRLDELLRTQISFQENINQIRHEIGLLRAARQSEAVKPHGEAAPIDSTRSDASRPPPEQPGPQVSTVVVTEQYGRPTGQPVAPSAFSRYATEYAEAARANLEEFIGENLISKIGIVILILGIGIGVKYAIDNNLISPLTRIILGYVFGLGLVGLAIRLKPKYHNFSAVLLSGGMAAMYFVTYFAHALYDLVGLSPAFALMTMFTVFTVAAAWAYNRQVIAHIGLVGAYAVPFLLSNNSGAYAFLFSYMSIVNVGILAISIKRKWKAIVYTSFVFTWLIYGAWYAESYDQSVNFAVAATFAVVFFLIFYLTTITLRLIFDDLNIFESTALILTNSFVFYGFGYALLDGREEFREREGLYTAANAVFHYGIALTASRLRSSARDVVQLLAILVLTFATIAIPIQFDGNRVTLIWAVEGALLFAFARMRQIRIFEYYSYPVLILATFSMFIDWLIAYAERSLYEIDSCPQVLANGNFVTAMIFVAAFALVVIVNKNERFEPHVPRALVKPIGYACAAIGLFVLYNAFRTEIDNYYSLRLAADISNGIDTTVPSVLELMNAIWQIMYTMGFMIALGIVDIRWVRSVAVGYAVIALGVLTIAVYDLAGNGIFFDLRSTYMQSAMNSGWMNIAVRYLSFLFAAGLFFILHRTANSRSMEGAMPKRAAELGLDGLIALSILILASGELINVMEQLRLPDSSKYGLSVLWGAYALAVIAVGIKLAKKHLRIFGIVLLGITLAKLFIYDIADLPTIPKTILFVSLGILMLIVSFLYTKYRHVIFGVAD